MITIGNIKIDPSYLYYNEYVWLSVEDENEVLIGLTDFGQQQLKDIINIDVASTSQRIATGKPLATIESISREYVLKSPVSCVVLEVNEDVVENPELLNEKPFSSWLVRVEAYDPDELDKLMDSDLMADQIADLVEITEEKDDLDDDFEFENEMDSEDEYYDEYEEFEEFDDEF